LLSFERNLMRMYQALHRKPELHVFATKELAVLAEKMETMSEGEILAEDEGLRDLAPEGVENQNEEDNKSAPLEMPQCARAREARVSQVLSTSFSEDFSSILRVEKSSSSFTAGGSSFTKGDFTHTRGLDTIDRLKKGFTLFKEKVEKVPGVFDRLKLYQAPKVMVISCVDSRVSPNMVLQALPGEIFTHRNVANLVPPYEKLGAYHGTSSAIEYAVCHLKIEHIIIMGHSNCGGIRSLMDDKESDDIEAGKYGMDFIPKWMSLARPAREQAKRYCKEKDFQEQCTFCEREAINGSLGNLLTFPFVKDAINQRKLALHGWYYDMAGPHLSTWNMQLLISNMQVI